MIVTEWGWLSDFVSALGLFIDMVGFWILAGDAISAFRSERVAWSRVRDVRSAAFRSRYAIVAPDRERKQRENDAFQARLDAEQVEFESVIDAREWRVRTGVSLIILGFFIQIIGVAPFWP